MKRVAVFYYSYTEQCKHVAEKLRKSLPADWKVDLVRIKAADPAWQLPVPLLPFWRRFLAIWRPTTAGELIPLTTEPAEIPECDLAVVGGPTWFSSPSVPMNSFLRSEVARRALAGKPVALFAGCRGVYKPNLAKMQDVVEQQGGHVIDKETFNFQGSRLTSFLAFFSFMMTGTQRARWLGQKLPPYGFTPEMLDKARGFAGRIVAAADTPAPARKPDPVAASPGAWRAFRLFFLGLAVLDLLLPLFLIPSGVTGFEPLGIGTYAQPRFFQLCVAAFLIQYAYIQYTAFRNPRAHATCVTLTLFIRLTFPIMYTSAIIAWGEP